MRQRTPPRANARCPLCDRPVVVGTAHADIGGRIGEIMFAPRPREELIAACSVHGHSPFNNMTREVEGKSP
jgi:hypothetical protein